MNDYSIFETEHFAVSQAQNYRVPGYVIVRSKADRTRLDEFTPDQATDLVRCLAEAERLVQEVIAPERIYILKFGEEVPRVHFHVFPRTARIANAYLKQVSDKKPYCGARIMDWIWHHHASLGFTDGEISGFVGRAREALQHRVRTISGPPRSL